MKYSIQENFHFTKQERRGIVGLSFLCLAFFFVPHLYPLFQQEEAIDFSNFEQQIAQLDFSNNPIEDDKPKSYYTPTSKLKKALSPFPFDPNKVSHDDLIKMGLSQKVATTFIKYRTGIKQFTNKEQLQNVYGIDDTQYKILEPFIQLKEETQKSTTTIPSTVPIKLFKFNPNTVSKEELLQLGFKPSTADRLIKYRSKGAQFRKKEDLSLIYGLSKEKFYELKPYIQLDNQTNTPIKTASTSDIPKQKTIKKKPTLNIDINQATVEEWALLYGIGPSLSNRIVKFRDKLGGFTSIEQVTEVYGLPDSTYQNIKNQLSFSPIFRQININKATNDELKAHPYLKWNQAKVIVSYRNNHGNYSNIDDLRKVKILDDNLIQKLQPYLTFD